jgi:hypothetical protein
MPMGGDVCFEHHWIWIVKGNWRNSRKIFAAIPVIIWLLITLIIG